MALRALIDDLTHALNTLKTSVTGLATQASVDALAARNLQATKAVMTERYMANVPINITGAGKIVRFECYGEPHTKITVDGTVVYNALIQIDALVSANVEAITDLEGITFSQSLQITKTNSGTTGGGEVCIHMFG